MLTEEDLDELGNKLEDFHRRGDLGFKKRQHEML
jgi:hypothetical protein